MTSVEELAEVVKALKTKLEEKDEEITKLESKVRKQDHFLQTLKDKIECPVCMDIPRSGPVSVCPNGHFVCENCKTASCHICRTDMGVGKSLLAGSVLENIEHSCKFEDCIEGFPVDELEKHEAGCAYRTVSCLYCSEEMSLSNLVDHLLSSSKCCVEDEDPLETLDLDKNRRHYYKDVKAAKNTQTWRMHIYNVDDETFSVFPFKSGGQFYFVLVMFASEKECANYKFEMMVQEDEHEGVVDSETSVNFYGRPLSIDMKKDGLKLYRINGQLMDKIVERSVCKSAFSLSFKISKKENT